jgi:hypothetical protein
MGNKDDVGAPHPLAKSQGAFATKTVVADLRNLVDQIDIEIDC